MINEFMSLNNQTLQDEDGDYSDWIEIYNPSVDDINLLAYSLSDNMENPEKWSFPDIVLPAEGFILVFASGKDKINSLFLHTNFKISSDGEAMYLFSYTGELLDSTDPISLNSDRSYGRSMDGSSNWGVYIHSTPGNSNNDQQFEQNIAFSHESGFYESPFYLNLQCLDTIRFTLNGSAPNNQSPVYNEPLYIYSDYLNGISMIPTNSFVGYGGDPYIEEYYWRPPKGNVEKAVIVRAQSFKDGMPSGDVFNGSFFIGSKTYSFPVISLMTDSLGLFGYDSGIYVPGQHFDEQDVVMSGNFHQKGSDWERVAGFDFFDESGKIQISTQVGSRIHGAKSRAAPQKSLRIYARPKYGSPDITYPFFSNRNYDTFQRLIFRSPYTYYWWGQNTLFRDDMIQSHIAAEFPEMDVQHSLPAVLFLNGEYWGIHNIRERQDEFYFESLYGVSPDSIDILQGNLNASAGSAEEYQALLDYVYSTDLSGESAYQHLNELIDVENYMDYLIIQLYFGNYDWPGNNTKFWKEKKAGEKWKWMVFDLDATLWDYNENHLQRLYDINPTELFFREMLRNESFEKQFVERFSYCLNGPFHPDKLESKIWEFKNRYEPEVDEHIRRWGSPVSYQEWMNSINHMVDYVRNRPCAMKFMLIDFFGIEEMNFPCVASPENWVSVFPNPCSDYLRISVDVELKEGITISLIDGQGRRVYHGKLEDYSMEINTSHVSSGMYFLQVVSGEDIFMKKLMVL